MILGSKLSAQTDTTIILPTKSNGTVQLNIANFTNTDVKNFGYHELAIFVVDEEGKYGPIAVQGNHTIEGDYLVFSPYFPFDNGITYMVKAKHVDTNSGHSYQSFLFGEKQVVDHAKILEIYPSGNQLPENLLRFYIYFNTPMKKGQALKCVQVTDSEGNVDSEAFMQFKQELWSPDGKRLTILFDPGRIKRGVSTNMELGPALLEGGRYHLTILGTWKDVHGQELSVKTTKEFVVGKAYRQHINVNELKITKPEANSDDTLSIHFDRIIDHALVQSMIRIEDENKELVAGHWRTSEEERTAQFIPEKIWKKETYQIIMDSRLEDVAGNNLNNLLDQKTGKKNSNIQQVIRPFTI